MVKTPPSNVVGVGAIPSRGAKTPCLMTEKPTIAKTKQNKSNIVTNSIKTLKMVHIYQKKNIMKKKLLVIPKPESNRRNANQS